MTSVTLAQLLDDGVVALGTNGLRAGGAELGEGAHRSGDEAVEALALEVSPTVGLIGDHSLEENGNASRSRRQEKRGAIAVEDPAGSVRSPRPGKLIVPEAKRCEALTTRGARCKAPKLRGLRVCMFHGHLSSTDERLLALADETSDKPRLSPRRALQAVAEMRAGEMAVAAVDGALRASNRDGGRAVLALVDAVDPQALQTATLTVQAGDVDSLSFAQLSMAVRSLIDPPGPMDTGLEATS